MGLRKVTVAALAALALTVGACGDDDGEDEGLTAAAGPNLEVCDDYKQGVIEATDPVISIPEARPGKIEGLAESGLERLAALQEKLASESPENLETEPLASLEERIGMVAGLWEQLPEAASSIAAGERGESPERQAVQDGVTLMVAVRVDLTACDGSIRDPSEFDPANAVPVGPE